MKALILCGGRGTRAHPHTQELPKPLLEVGRIPVLRHVMDIYASQGYREFVLAAGFKAELIEGFARDLPAGWEIDVVDTGENTNKGDRVIACRDALGEGDFFVTYGDGLGNIRLDDQIGFHKSHGGVATVTTVPLTSQYGTVDFDSSGLVERFVEKPVIATHWINAGFLIFDGAVLGEWPGGDLESDVLPAFSRQRRLFAYRHEGFWRSMDTHKDSLDLTSIYEQAGTGGAPWLNFAEHASS